MSTIWVSAGCTAGPRRGSAGDFGPRSPRRLGHQPRSDPSPKSTAGRKSFSAAAVISTLWVRTTPPQLAGEQCSAAEATSRSKLFHLVGLAHEVLARDCHHDRIAQMHDLVEIAHKLMAFGRLAKAGARIDADAEGRCRLLPRQRPHRAGNRALPGNHVPVNGSSCMVAGSPSACMTTQPQPQRRTALHHGGSRKPDTSLTMEAPQSGGVATPAWRVSTDTQMPVSTRAATRHPGMRFHFIGVTGVAPGRVDSPPTSTMAAPARTISPVPTAASDRDKHRRRRRNRGHVQNNRR